MAADVSGRSARFDALAQALPHLRATLRWIDYAETERLCEQWAAQFVAEFGRDELRRFAFQAIPRGGLLVLGILSYLLDLTHIQLVPEEMPAEAPLVLVDDCALSGLRFGQTLRMLAAPDIIFAPMLSHPDLRAAILDREPRVRACLSAGDLHDYAPDRYPDPADLAAWRARWADASPDAYWTGLPEHLVFAWAETDYRFWNPQTGATETGWYLFPPHLCLKSRVQLIAPLGDEALGADLGPLRPAASVIHGDFDDHLLLVNLLSEECLTLEGVAAEIWRALIATGDLAASAALIAARYDVPLAEVMADVEALIAPLQADGFIVSENPDTPFDGDLSSLWPHAQQHIPPPRGATRRG